jgi:hypothetical protein
VREAERPRSVRYEKWDHLPAVLAIGPKVAVGREHNRVLNLLCHPDQTGVGEGHRQVSVFVNQLPQSLALGQDIEFDRQKTAAEQFKKTTWAVVQPGDEIKSFRQHRLAGEKWRGQLVQTLDGPDVVQIRLDQDCHQRPGIDKEVIHQTL